MYPVLNTVTLIVLICARHLVEAETKPIYHISLKEDNSITLHWNLDYNHGKVSFEVHLPSKFGWFAIGFSDYGSHFPADYCILWNDYKRKTRFQDIWTDVKGVAHLDKLQDCRGFRMKKTGGITKFTFTRKFDTCDFEDYIIEDGTTHIVWARGDTALYQINGLNISSPHSSEDQGMARVQLLQNENVKVNKLPSHVEEFDVLTDKVQVPAEETTYWCHVHKLSDDFKKKHHIYQYEANIQKSSAGVVHHMELFHCEAPPDQDIPLYVGNCFAKDRPEATQVCKRVFAAWAMGAPPLTYPDEAGLPIGGPDYNLHVMLEVHYNNPGRKSGIVDTSGIKFYASTKLKAMDAGIIELGLEYTDKMAIPPGQESFPLTGYCVSECTAVSLPQEGITIFASQLHTHLTGTRVITRHFRDGQELAELNRDNHYSTHFQEIRKLKNPVKILPGDALLTTCDYKTEDRENVTLGGFAITDEMCVNYVHYFPAADLEVCKSAISDQALTTYFNYMRQWEDQPTSPLKGISDNYKSIEWNKMRVKLLENVYREAPLSMQCNMSNGDRFPGYWENTPLTPILKPLPPPSRHQC